MNEFKIQQLKSVIKDLLKKKKMTYEDVANELNCSVPTVKRILGDEELTLSRLLELCDILEVNLTDLETLTKTTSDKVERFTEEQQIFLAKNKNFLAYLVHLFDETPEQIAEKYKLTQKSTDKYLLGLEKNNLIKVNAKLKVKPAFKQLPSLENGPLAKAYYEGFIQNSANFFIQNISERLYSPNDGKETPKGFSVQNIVVTEESYKAFITENLKSFESFIKLASYEEKSKPKEQLKSAVVLQAFTIVEQDYKGLEILTKALGEIINI
ncbi:helix-turn-helix domain-containing protein [Bdellovibrio svalbardensis]|uniref:Helix-turn-helix transcriptional regulator n=1 Tax=Bdellovibrio svalbardensis TaxID=2972972 RepID=A0ABT6DJR2_9BACT|nr:helix-turn-helix transcriptional regulator [Bdellovibrio svalbardensis]MDG0816737.1 helix-turn-helix transcriptional regulator [Bdellovibrio svalbardensis]